MIFISVTGRYGERRSGAAPAGFTVLVRDPPALAQGALVTDARGPRVVAARAASEAARVGDRLGVDRLQVAARLGVFLTDSRFAAADPGPMLGTPLSRRDKLQRLRQ